MVSLNRIEIASTSLAGGVLGRAKAWHAAAEIDSPPPPTGLARRLLNRVKARERATHRPGCQGGALGSMAVRVYTALLFDFRYMRDGLIPPYKAIARAVGCCVRAVGAALRRLRAQGFLKWRQRWRKTTRDGRCVIEQEPNEYTILPESCWTDHTPDPAPPPPLRGTWGDPAPMPSVLAEAVAEQRASGDARTVVAILQCAPAGGLEAALASLRQSMWEAEMKLSNS